MAFSLNPVKYFFLPKRLKSKWSYNDFLYMHMQYMTVKKIETFLTEKELWDAERTLNADAYRKYFNSKRLFYERFGSYMKREIIPIRDITKSEMISFIKARKKAVFKPDDKYAGIGFFIASCDENGEVVFPGDAPSFEEMQNENYIMEEYVCQHKAYSDMYDLSLNTVRVTTFIKKDQAPEILFVVNQFGSEGSIVDNDDITSIWNVTDPETGIIIACEEDDNNGFLYETHPDSKKPFIGFKNPCFEEIKNTALKAAVEIPECRLVGWDIAVRQDGEIVIIEGNVTPELWMYQRLSHDGLIRITDI